MKPILTSMNRASGALMGAALFASSIAANAGIIIQDQYSTILQVFYFQPVGQSFVAEDPNVLVAFNYQCISCPFFPNTDALQMQMLRGAGLGGPVLATSAPFNLPDTFTGFFDVDFSALNLRVGEVYTAVLNVLGTSPYWGVRGERRSNEYADGSAFFGQPSEVLDLSFRITPVPEPG